MGRKSNKEVFKKYEPTVYKIMKYLMNQREIKEISRNEMARMLEIDPASLDRLEKNRQIITMPFYLKYCDILDLDPVIAFQRALFT